MLKINSTGAETLEFCISAFAVAEKEQKANIHVFARRKIVQEKYVITCDVVVAGFVENAGEELEADDGVDDDHEDDQQRDVEQGDHRHED